ncbi:MAG: putative glycolipid-binding domain-containing protein [Dehalococcoidia bacterium]
MTLPDRSRRVAWAKEDPFGVEFVEVSLRPDALTAEGVAIGSDPVPYRLDYTLATGRRFVTSRLVVTTRSDGWRCLLDLRRSADGDWRVDRRSDGTPPFTMSDADAAVPSEALDCDLGLCPLTNTMPVLREGLLSSQSQPAEIVVAWISVPDLAIHAARQRYRHVRREENMSVVRFEDDDGFTADILFDADGLVIDYPELARRL